MSVTRLDITYRTPFESGKSFGDIGPYTYVEGKVYFEVDPLDDSNVRIVDLDLAPKNSEGLVEFSSDFSMLFPSDPSKGRRTMFLDVVNRGNRTVLSGFNKSKTTNLLSPFSSGNGFLMNQGYTIVFCGWQADVPSIPGLISLDVPEAFKEGEPLRGLVMNQYQANDHVNLFPLADRYHLINPAASIDDARLFVGEHPNGDFHEVSNKEWFITNVEDRDVEPDPTHVYMKDGFEKGKIYQLVYTAKGSRIVGLGFAAVRDICSYLKYSSDSGNPVQGSIDRAISYGASQSGRFLRQYIHTGMNIDEDGRSAMDGIIAHVGGGMRGEFNLRFGQPSKDVCFIIPELFPFTDLNQRDPETGAQDGLLDRMSEQGDVPKIMFTNSSAEYWRGDAALIHTDLESMEDADEHKNVRRYHFSGTQHGQGEYPSRIIRESDQIRGHLPFNAVDYSPILRACLNNMDDWVKGIYDAPVSCHPMHLDGSAVQSKSLLEHFDKVPEVRVPESTLNPIRLDYGDQQHLGRTTKLPPRIGKTYPSFVSQIDNTLNEIAGIRLPDISVPVTTNTGWNPRHETIGNPGLLIGITGGLAGWTIPLPATDFLASQSGDPRPSVESLYLDKQSYLELVKNAVQNLLSERYILEGDIDEIMELAEYRYDDVMGIS